MRATRIGAMKPGVIRLTAILAWLSMVSTLISDDKVSFRTNFFSDNSGTTVQSPALEASKSLTRDATVSVRYTMDRVIIPPIRGLSATPSPVDAVTGASRPVSGDEPATESYVKRRNEITAALTLPRFSLGYYYSSEKDYLGQMASVSTNVDFNRKNTNLSVMYSYGWDRIEPLGADTRLEKTAHSVNATITQALSPKMAARFGVDFAYVSGFQSNPYRSVFTAGLHRLEVHPQERLRGALFVKVNRYFSNQSSFGTAYRYYRDDWEIQSHTLDSFYHQILSDKALIRYRYRYYTQSAAFFYRPSYATLELFMTSDYKLEKFNSHLFGVKLEYRLKDLAKGGFFQLLSKATFEVKYERYFSSNDFTADIFQFGLVFNY